MFSLIPQPIATYSRLALVYLPKLLSKPLRLAPKITPIVLMSHILFIAPFAVYFAKSSKLYKSSSSHSCLAAFSIFLMTFLVSFVRALSFFAVVFANFTASDASARVLVI